MLRILQSRQLFGVKKKLLKEVLIAYDIEGSSFSIDLVISYKYIFFQKYICVYILTVVMNNCFSTFLSTTSE